MKKILLSAVVASGLLVSNSFGQEISLSSGWQLKGTESNLSINDFHKVCVDTVWKYNKKWEAYSPNSLVKELISNNGISEIKDINKNDGFWVNANSDCNISTNDEKESNLFSENINFKDSKEYIFDATTFTNENGKIKASNFRIKSDKLNFDDYISAYFNFDINTGGFKIDVDSIKIYKDFGLYYPNNEIVFKDVNDAYKIYDNYNNEYSLSVKNTNLVFNESSSLNLELEQGQSFSVYLNNCNANYTFKLLKENGDNIYNYSDITFQSFLFSKITIFETGTYKLKIIPTETNTITCDMTFMNSNSNKIKTIKNGYTYNVNLSEYAKYDKFKVNLDVNQTLDLNLDNNNGQQVNITIVNNSGKYIKSIFSSEDIDLIYKNYIKGTYYIFIEHTNIFEVGNYKLYSTISSN